MRGDGNVSSATVTNVAVSMGKRGGNMGKEAPRATSNNTEDSLLLLLLPALEGTLSPKRFSALEELVAMEGINTPLRNPVSLYDELRPEMAGQDVLVMLLQHLMNGAPGDLSDYAKHAEWCRGIYNSFNPSSYLIRLLAPLGTGGGRVSIGGPLSDLAVARIVAQIDNKRGVTYVNLPSVSLSNHIREKRATTSLRRAVKIQLSNAGAIPRWIVSGHDADEWNMDAVADYYTFHLRQHLYGTLLPEPWMDGGAVRSALSDEAWGLRGQCVSVLSKRTHLLNRSYSWEEGSPIPSALFSHRGRFTGAEAIATAALVEEYNDEWVAALISRGE